MLRIGHRTYYCNLFYLGIYGKCTCIFQKYGALLHGFLSGRERCGSIEPAGVGLVDIRIVEQAQAIFQTQHVGHHRVQLRLAHLAALHQFLKVGDIGIALHVDVHAGCGGLLRAMAQVGAVAVGNHLIDGAPVAHHHAVVAPLVAQDVVHELAVARRRHAVDVVERAHERGRACFSTLLERGQIHVAQQLVGNPCGVVVLAAFAGAITGEMLHAGGHGVGTAEVVALVAAHHRHTQRAGEHGVLAKAFGYASPARIAGDVHHRRERPAYAHGTGLVGSYAGAFLHQCGIPRGSLPERDGEEGLETVNHVAGKYQRYSQTRIFHSIALQGVHHGGVGLVEYRTYRATLHLRYHFRFIAIARQLIQLPDFLVEGHAAEQLADARLDIALRADGRQLHGSNRHRKYTSKCFFHIHNLLFTPPQSSW